MDDKRDPKGGWADLDSLWEADEEGWADAIDEWDQGLDLPAESSAAPAGKVVQQVAEAPQGGSSDPLVDFITSDDAEVDFQEEAGEALGSLLGSTPTAKAPGGARTPRPAEPVEAADGRHDLDFRPAPVADAELEIEINAEPTRPLSLELEAELPAPQDALEIEAEPPPRITRLPEMTEWEQQLTPVKFVRPAEDIARTEPAPLAANPSEEDEQPTRVAAGQIFSVATAFEEDEQPTRVAPDLPLVLAQETKEQTPAEESKPARSELEVLEALEPLVAAGAQEEIEFKAGEVLPGLQVKEASEARGQLVDDLEAADLSEPEVTPPPIPESLLHLALSDDLLPSKGEPLRPERQYWQTLAERLQLEANLTDAANKAAALELMTAGACEALGEVEEAIDHYREVLNHRPDHVPAMRELRRLYTSKQEMALVAEVLAQMSERVGPAERLALNAVRAELLWSTGGDDAGAERLLEDIAPVAQGDLRSLLIRADLAHATGDDETLTELLATIIENIEDSRLEGAFFIQLGRRKEHQAQLEPARHAFQQALAREQDCLVARQGLLRVARQLGDHRGAVEALAPAPGLAGAWSARRRRRRAVLAQAQGVAALDARQELERAAELAADDPMICWDLAAARAAAGDQQAAIDGFVRLGQLLAPDALRSMALLEASRLAQQQPLADLPRAVALAREAEALAPELPAVRTALGQLLLHGEDLGAAAALLQEAAGRQSGSQRAACHLGAAEFFEALNDGEAAVGELMACLEHEPANPSALTRLEQLYRQNGSLEQLAAVLDTAAQATEQPDVAAELLEHSALIYEGSLRRPAQGAARFRQALQQNPKNLSARRGIARCLTQTSDEAALLEELALAAASADSSRAAALWTVCGDLLWAAGQWEKAENNYRMAVDAAADWLPASWPLVIGLAGQARWSEVLELWAAQAGGDLSPAWRRALELRQALAAERALGDQQLALVHYQAASNAELPAPGAKEGVLRAARRLGSLELLTDQLSRQIEQSTKPAERSALSVRAAESAWRAGQEFFTVEAGLRAALEENPSYPLAAQALEHLYLEHGALQQLSDQVLSELGEESPHQRRLEAYLRIAALDQRREDDDSARLSYESLLELDAGNTVALRFLQRYFLRRGQWPAAAAALRKEAEQAYAPEDAAALWLELARLLAQRPLSQEELQHEDLPLGQQPEDLTSKKALLASLEQGPEQLLPWRALVDAAWLTRDQQGLGEAYLGLAQAVADGREAGIFFTRAGELLSERQVELMRGALSVFPEHLVAAYRLRNAALKLNDWEAAGTAAEAEGRDSHHPRHAAFAFLLAGEICREQLFDWPRAAENYQLVLLADPVNGRAFAQLRSHYEEQGQWVDLAALLQGRLEVEPVAKRRAAIHRQLAEVGKTKLEDPALAKEQLRSLLALLPEDHEALAALAELHRTDGEWAEVADVLLRLLRSESAPGRRRELLLEIGEIYQDRLEDLQRALVSLNELVALEPGHLGALERLSDLHSKQQDFKRALAVSMQLLEREPADERRVAHALRIARIQEDGLKDQHQAALAFRRALELNPDDLHAIGELCGFFARQNDQRSLMIHLDRSVANMRAKLHQDPFATFPYHSLFQIFGWRNAPDGQFCAAQVLEALGALDPAEQVFLDEHRTAVGAAGSRLGADDFDERLFDRSIPSGFRQVFQLLAEPFAKMFSGDLKSHGIGRGDRITSGDQLVRRIGDALARDLGVGHYELYIGKQHPTRMIVENTDPPAIILGSALLQDCTEEELQFIMGRCLWTIRKGMVLPVRLTPEDLEVLVAGIVRQYAPEFQPAEAPPQALHETTRQVARAIPRKLRQSLMPFALECSGPSVDLRAVGSAATHSANRAGLMACRSPYAALLALCKASGKASSQAGGAQERIASLRGNWEAEELIRFAVSDAHFELRRGMEVAVS